MEINNTRMLKELIAKLDEVDAPDARDIIQSARKLIKQSSKPIRRDLIKVYEPILKIYEREYNLN